MMCTYLNCLEIAQINGFLWLLSLIIPWWPWHHLYLTCTP